MPIINSYPQDIDVQDNDAWIGTDYNTKGTKQYTAEAVANYLNQKGKVSIAGQVSYKFVDTPFTGQGTMALSPNNGSSFSAITGFKIAKADLSGQGIQEYLDYLIGREIIIVNQNDPNSFGHYSIYTYTVDGNNDQYYDLVVTFLGGNGSIVVNSFYSLANFTFGGGASTIATLANIGIGNVNPSTYPTLKGLTVSYNNGTATIGLNIQDLPNTTIPTSASDILVPWAAEVSGVTYNSKATLQDLIDDTGVVGGPYLPLTGGTLTGDLYVNTKVGIGTASPNQLLEVANSAGDATISISTNQSAGSQASKKYINLDFAGYNNNVMAKIQSWDESFSGGNGYLTFSTRNATTGLLSQGMVLDYLGNVGIGTTVPADKLSIAGSLSTLHTGRTTKALRVTMNSNDTLLSLYARADQSNQQVLLRTNGNSYLNGGNVGIGTTSPSSKLQVSADNGDGITLQHGPSNAFYILRSGNDDTIIKQIRNYTSKISISTLADSGTHESSGLNIVGQGDGLKSNVGIGTSSPSEKLEVNSGDVLINNSTISTLKSGGSLYLDLNTFGAYGGRNFRVQNNGNVHLNIDSTGNVGIGTTAPGATLPTDSETATKVLQLTGVSGSTGDTAVLLRSLDNSSGLDLWHNVSSGDSYIDNRYNSNQGDTIFRAKTAGTPLETLRITGNGNVGIGTTSPGSKLTVSGSFSADTGLFSNELTLASDLRLQSNITILNKAQTSYISFATRNTSGSEAVIDLTNVGSINGGAAGPYLPLTGGTLSGNVKVDKGSAPGKTAYLSDDGLYIGRLSAYGGGYPSNIIVDPSSPNHLDINSRSRINLKLDNNTVLVANDSGSVGIGTTTPSEKLYVAGSIGLNTGQSIKWGAGATKITGIDGSYISFNPNNSEKVRFLANGNVGIGTTSPLGKLHVESGSVGVALVPVVGADELVLENSGDAGLSIFTPNTNKGSLVFGDPDDAFVGGLVYDHNNDKLTFKVNNSDEVTIDSSGNVGIGTTSPSFPLHVNTSNDVVAYLKSSDNKASILLADNDTQAYLSVENGRLGFGRSNGVSTNNITILQSNNNVGIGTTSPGAKLEVEGNATVDDTPQLIVASGGADHNAIIHFTDDAGGQVNAIGALEGNILTFASQNELVFKTGTSSILGNTNTKMTIATDGKVGIGTISPSSKLEVDGGDIEVDDSASGLILKSSDGTRYRITVANGGTLTVTAV